MSKNLVIVESPAKARTISKFLGKEYLVQASMGHVRDLPKSKTGVDTENNFEPSYLVPQDKKRIVASLKKLLSKNPIIWIATDEDREGEAIGWHLLQALKINPKKQTVKRIVFHEITKGAILKAIATPRDIDMNLVNAQQARRILDRLVGYELSPLLWNKIRYGLSAGRVQSVAVRLIVDREREIRAFKPEEYWTIVGDFLTQKQELFSAMLQRTGETKLKIESEKQAQGILATLKGAHYTVTSVEEKDVKRTPSPPFITSTLQQEAARKLRFSVKKTMVLAQQLYEGIDLGEKGLTGLITYMRTDSVNIAASALQEAREVIKKEFGAEFALEKPRFYRSKKGAQEAHEAIRPVRISLLPSSVKNYLDRDQFRLYDLIWKRMVACQMREALLKQSSIDVTADVKEQYVFRATGQTIVFPGFMKAYTEGHDAAEKTPSGDVIQEYLESESFLPVVKQGEHVALKTLTPKQHFTIPPPRYTEASLVKKLEQEGIGRPSTYAPTISTIITRGYIIKEGPQLKPTDTAEVVTDVLTKHFSDIVDLKFTARMEEDLDNIAEGIKEWVSILRDFYKPFHTLIETKKKTLQRSDIISEKTEEVCDLCGSNMVIKLGRFGKFLSCAKYPSCKNAKPLAGSSDGKKDAEFVSLAKKFKDKKCEKCKSLMEVKKGRFGSFLGCSNYPKCKNIKPIIKFTGVRCPQCNGQLIERRTRKGGKIFYGCNKYPKCRFALWDKPVETPCPSCKGLQVMKKDQVVCTTCSK